MTLGSMPPLDEVRIGLLVVRFYFCTTYMDTSAMPLTGQPGKYLLPWYMHDVLSNGFVASVMRSSRLRLGSHFKEEKISRYTPYENAPTISGTAGQELAGCPNLATT